MATMLPMAPASARDRVDMQMEPSLQARRDDASWRPTTAPYPVKRAVLQQLIGQGFSEDEFTKVNPGPAAESTLSVAVSVCLQSVLDPAGGDWEKTAWQSLQIVMAGLKKPADWVLENANEPCCWCHWSHRKCIGAQAA